MREVLEQMTNSTRQKCADVMKDRVFGVSNDLKAYVYIRNNNIQHKDGNIGGGNTVAALSLFTALNFLAKCYYCTLKPKKFDEKGYVDETASFIAFMKFIQAQQIDLNLPENGEILSLVWNGFRNHLAHRLTVESGKSVLNFIFEEPIEGTIDEILERAGKHPVFEHQGDNRNWVVNGDSLLSKLMPIADVTANYILGLEEINEHLLVKVLDIDI